MRLPVLICAGFLLSIFLPPLYALDEKHPPPTPQLSGDAAKLVGVWEITRTKEPGKPYRTGFRGRPFVSKGPNSFTLVLEYRRDGTYRRVVRISGKETVQKGRWTLSGHELRQRAKGRSEDEVVYLRFDEPDRYTSIEVYEDTNTPGLFAQYQKKGMLKDVRAKVGTVGYSTSR